MPQTKFLRPAAHQQANPKVLDPVAEVDAQHAQRYGHFGFSPALRPARVILWVGMRWQQMQAQEVDTPRTKACGNTLQMAARRLLGQQVAKRVDGAVGRINWSTETEIGHLSLESLSMEQAPCKPPSKVTQCWLAKIKAGHFVTSGGQLDN